MQKGGENQIFGNFPEDYDFVNFILNKILKSLQFRIVMLLIIISSIACFLVKEVIVGAYEDRAVAWRTAEIQEQCTILSNQLTKSTYMKSPVSDVVDAELSQFSNIYNGRVIIVDKNFRIVKDTFGGVDYDRTERERRKGDE